ncbi:CocE/NonD family hydrolase C-terminal non-catalytic domain-containing protein [Spongiibacter nanhainus]|uniref:CocE/NonD family hydrolase C-terminal non-catalytic domain-containing protein n=1 Tax=Spongiibacter nanhainus TaxID=2794344 RepID=UPI001E4E0692|nr:CocE/NonD family hydrolase C-terminal non-catalytic domain-containing protein [Spongiibacter nanhainus]
MIGSQRAVDPEFSWYDENGQMIQAFHPYFPSSAQRLVPDEVARFDIEVRPTAVQINEGERLRITVSTSDIPFAFRTVDMVLDLVGSSYLVQRNSIYPSSVTVPMLDPTSFVLDCAICGIDSQSQ